MYSTHQIISISFIVALAFITLSSTARAVDPPPDGGYPNFNTAEGEDALFSLTTGGSNTAMGSDALYSNTTGLANTAIGWSALLNNTTGVDNTAVGSQALIFNTTGLLNTAVGWQALFFNTTGQLNTATGASALYANTTGTFNTANGYQALALNTTGGQNTAVGSQALNDNTTGLSNTATGISALAFNTTGEANTANGAFALFRNMTGSNNSAIGISALSNNKHGDFNTAIGTNAMLNNENGSNNIALGYRAGRLLSGDGNIAIGNPGVRDEAGTIRIGKTRNHTNTYIAGISGVTVAGGVGVIIDTDGHLGTVVSSARFKDEIQPMDKASEAILALKPVTFRYKKELDPKGIPQFGLVAEQVEKVNPDLVARDEQGKPYTVRYEAVNAMLLNEFLKEHRKVEEQECKLAVQDRKSQEQDATITQLKSAIAQQRNEFQTTANRQQNEIEALTATLKAQAAQIQKVSDRIGARAPVPRVAANN